MSAVSSTPLLDRIQIPFDLRNLSVDQLKQLGGESRAETIHAVSLTGGHLGASLGVVELAIALHAVFETVRDRVIWDVGHQAYPHKIPTGRRDRIRTLRQGGGLSECTHRAEIEYDPFGAARSSTSISAGLGMATARDLKGEKERQIIAVIGDGAMSAGMAYEAANNAGASKTKLIVALNDNDMSISRPVGTMSVYLARLIAEQPFLRPETGQPEQLVPHSSKDAELAADPICPIYPKGDTLFTAMGFRSVGPIDGHDLDRLVLVLRDLRDSDHQGPTLVHVVSEKGKGYGPAERSADKYHGVMKFDIATGESPKLPPGPPSYTKVFAEALIGGAEADESIVAVTAAMPSGTGLEGFRKRFPSRMFDVGIAEQHAVTFAAGMAAEGMKPFCVIYSAFLRRAYDQVVHHVALQSLPVRFALDRAGLVGADGATHAGAFDIVYLGCLPNMVSMAAADESEPMHMVATAAAIDDGPCGLRYPRGEGVGLALPPRGTPLEIGRGRVLREGSNAAILSYGTRLKESLAAADELAALGFSRTVADARFAKPLDTKLVERLAREHSVRVTVEEGVAGGFASLVTQHLAWHGLLDGRLKFRPMTLPDRLIEHDTTRRQYDEAGLNAAQIAAVMLTALGERGRRRPPSMARTA